MFSYSTIIRSVALRPNVSGAYISSALAGGATYCPGVVARSRRPTSATSTHNSTSSPNRQAWG
jgi:hypothetical protein